MKKSTGFAVAIALLISAPQYAAAQTVIDQLPVKKPLPQPEPTPIDIPDWMKEPPKPFQSTSKPFDGTSKPFGTTAKPSENIEFRAAANMSQDEIANYLRTMKGILEKYTEVVYSCVMSGQGGVPTAGNMSQASAQTQSLAHEIAAVKAPQEIFAQHKQLAMTLQSVDNFITASSGGGVAALPQALGLIANVQGTMTSYHSATESLRTKHGLPASYDPFGNDSADKKQQVTGIFESMKNQLMGGGQAAGAPAGDPLGGLGSMLGGLGGLGGNGTTGGGLGDLGKMFGTGGMGSMFGGGAGGSGSGGSGFGSGGSGGSGFGSGGSGLGSGTGADGSLDLNGLMKQMGDQQKTMDTLLNE